MGGRISVNTVCGGRTTSIAMIGCGAVAELFHLPVLARDPRVHLAFAVDSDMERARRVARTFGAAAVASHYHAVTGSIDAAIVALPHHLHEPVCVALLRSGVHVLVEKPMALSAEGCRAMHQAALEAHAVLAVGLYRRSLPSFDWVYQMVQSEAFGPLQYFSVCEGACYDWPLQSNYLLDRDQCGGGVLLDTGAHTLDQVLHWFGQPAQVEYFDDSHGGVESECRLWLRMPSGATGTVELSRTRRMRNTATIRFSQATVEVALTQNRTTVHWNGTGAILTGAILPIGDGATTPRNGSPDQQELIAAQLSRFLDAIDGTRAPATDGTESERSIALIDHCYEHRRQLIRPWEGDQQTGLPGSGVP